MNVPRVAVLAALSLLVGCKAGGGPAERLQDLSQLELPADVHPDEPGTLVFARAGDSLTLDPAAASDGESAKVIDSLFETLLAFDTDVQSPTRLVPGLATDWNHSADRMTWTFTLRRGVRFHDGTPLDAEAVKFSLERLVHLHHAFAPARVPYAATFRRIREVRVLGPHRFQLGLLEPSVVLLHDLAMFAASIVSPSAVKAKGAARFAREPVGSGPFRFESWERGSHIVLAANRDWWPGGERSTRRVVFLRVASWPARRELLKAGRVHMTDNVDFRDYGWLETTSGVKIRRAPGMNVCYLAINNEHAVLRDRRVRKAIAQAIDRERILRIGYSGAGVIAHDLLPASLGDDDPILPDTDVVTAKASFGRLRPQGIIELWYMKNSRPYVNDPERVALILRECLADAGLAVRLRAFEWLEYLKRIKAGEHHLALIGWTSDNGDPDNFYSPLLSQESIGETNYTRLRNAQFESYLSASRGEESIDTRHAYFRRMRSLLREDCPVVPLVHSTVAVACRSSVAGFDVHPIHLHLYGVTK
ncbi:MAG: hypothetical protein CMJ85_09210 [Planctomycetes bacterium]|nr:hypothetical protein [Planctomycetota bacterium]